MAIYKIKVGVESINNVLAAYFRIFWAAVHQQYCAALKYATLFHTDIHTDMLMNICQTKCNSGSSSLRANNVGMSPVQIYLSRVTLDLKACKIKYFSCHCCCCCSWCWFYANDSFDFEFLMNVTIYPSVSGISCILKWPCAAAGCAETSIATPWPLFHSWQTQLVRATVLTSRNLLSCCVVSPSTYFGAAQLHAHTHTYTLCCKYLRILKCFLLLYALI